MESEVAANTDGMVLSQPAAVSSEDGSATASWLLCRTGSHCFALPILHVIEIMRTLPIEPLAGAPPLVRGLCIIRGAPVPVVDAALLFDNLSTRCERIVTVRTGNRTIAFATETVLGVEAIRAHAVQQLPPLLRNIEAIAAITALDEELVFFLHTARILPEVDGINADGAEA
jgi:purine-binding chemotaxis protein CheW